MQRCHLGSPVAAYGVDSCCEHPGRARRGVGAAQGEAGAAGGAGTIPPPLLLPFNQ